MGEVLPVHVVVRLQEHLPQPRLTDRVVLGVELVKPVEMLQIFFTRWKIFLPVESVPVCVHVEHVHGEVVGGEVHGVEDLCQVHDLVRGAAHRQLALVLQRLLDESQQVFLIHAGRGVDMSINLSWATLKYLKR